MHRGRAAIRLFAIFLLLTGFCLPVCFPVALALPEKSSGTSLPSKESGPEKAAPRAFAWPSPAAEETESPPREWSIKAYKPPSALRDILLDKAASFTGLPGPGKPGSGLSLPSSETLRPGYDPFTGEYFRLFDHRPDQGNAHSSPLMGSETTDMVLSRGLSWASGLVNSRAESLLTSLADGARARLNFLIDGDGRLNGEGDVLLPLYDWTYSTIFTQLGLRTMTVNGGESSGQIRWIGNFGLGQRWYPFALDEQNAGNLMLGYNLFLDYDFTRSHQRGGAGLEVQADWLKLSSNYYWPLSGWKNSRDFDDRFIEERPARGWDARARAYLPFYRPLALTGSYTRWYGDHVGVFGPDSLEKNPRIWSYGLEFTPIPLLNAFVRQQSTEQGRTDSEIGLNLVYRFDLSAEDQLNPAKVAEAHSVSGSRHDFVDRENKIILEYRAKQDYRIEYLGREGDNSFRFRITKAFGGYAAGESVTVRVGGPWLAQQASPPPDGFLARTLAGLNALADELIFARFAHAGVSSKEYITDGRGEFLLALDPDALPRDGRVSVVVRVGNSEAEFTLQGTPSVYSLEASPGSLTQNAATTVTFTLKQGETPVAGKSLTFAANPNFSGLPSGAQTTGASGQITVS
ncbi:MAG: inverse autotransporter beta domain-containing protein, partial [Desulfovibrio sp.]|nr:inverse autotransporter beta domain-containing protein [Desulfovibrio sp.]